MPSLVLASILQIFRTQSTANRRDNFKFAEFVHFTFENSRKCVEVSPVGEGVQQKQNHVTIFLK